MENPESISKAPAQADTEILEPETGNHAPFSWFETDDLNYTLEVDHNFNDGNYLERIFLSRDEYAAAKAVVASMRGIKAEPEAKAA